MKIYSISVKGVVNFPIDMLRYDSCWPVSQDDAAQITASFGHRHDENQPVRLNSYQKPTPERWKSFGWNVLDVSKQSYSYQG